VAHACAPLLKDVAYDIEAPVEPTVKGRADPGDDFAAGTKWHLRLNQKARKWASKII
jgi:hypothetical protein